MKAYFDKFARSDEGAVTVDWVVLTAAVVALGVAAGATMVTSTGNLSDGIWAYMDGLNLWGNP